MASQTKELSRCKSYCIFSGFSLGFFLLTFTKTTYFNRMKFVTILLFCLQPHSASFLLNNLNGSILILKCTTIITVVLVQSVPTSKKTLNGLAAGAFSCSVMNTLCIFCLKMQVQLIGLKLCWITKCMSFCFAMFSIHLVIRIWMTFHSFFMIFIQVCELVLNVCFNLLNNC